MNYIEKQETAAYSRVRAAMDTWLSLISVHLEVAGRNYNPLCLEKGW